MVNLNEACEQCFTLEIIPDASRFTWIFCAHCDQRIIQMCYLIKYDEETQSMVFNESGFDWDAKIDLPDETSAYQCTSCQTRLDVKNEEDRVYIPREKLKFDIAD